MKVMLFSDLHDSSRGLSAIVSFLSKNKEIAGLIFAGDVTNMGEPLSFAEKFVAEISKFKFPLLWVPGNNDFGRSYKILQNFTPSLEGRIVEFGNRRFTGIGGSPASWSSEYAGENSLLAKQIAGTILISHYPPAGIRYFQNNNQVDSCHSEPIRVTQGKLREESQKSKILRSAQDDNTTIQPLDKARGKQFNNLPRKIVDFPLAHICGHVHNTQGIGYIGETKVVKLASSALGNVAIMNLDNLDVNFEMLI